MWQCSNKGISPFVVLGACLLCSLVSAAEDWATTQQLRNEERAAYWKERGYLFDASTLTAYQMDQQVRDIQRAQYWKTQGYDFDPRIMTAYQMDQQVKDIQRAQYWKTQGYDFDPRIMTAYQMDQQVKDIQRAQYWKTQGYDFDPRIMSAYQMDRAAAASRRSHNASSVSVQEDQNSPAPGVYSGVPTQRTPVLAGRPSFDADIQQYYTSHFVEEQIRALKSLLSAFGRPIDLSSSEWDSESHEAACDLQSLLGVAVDGKIGSNTLSALSVVLETTNEAQNDRPYHQAPFVTLRHSETEDDSESREIPERLIEGEKLEDNDASITWRLPQLGQPVQPHTAGRLSDFSSDPRPAIPPIAPGEKRDAEPPGRYLGNWSANQFAPNSTSNRFGAGNEFSPDSVRNEYGRYGSPYSSESANNPYATNAPRLYDSQGNYRGRLSSNPYDPESISNPYGRYGNRFSPDSVNNPFGAGNPFSADSPTNPFGQGLQIHGEK